MAAPVQDVFMLFGDSITQGAWEPGTNGFGQHLSHAYARKLDILNRGFSGYNTEWGLPVFKQVIAKRTNSYAPKIRVLTIWFGANDACIKPSPQHVPLDRFTSNLKEMVELIKSPESEYYSPETRIVLITPPPVNTHQRRADLESRNPPLKLDRLFDVTREYAEAVKRVGRETEVAVVDIWSAIWKGAGEDEAALSQFFPDGLHLNAPGYEIMYEALMRTIGDVYPEVHPSNLGFVFAPWAEIDWDGDTEKTLEARRIF